MTIYVGSRISSATGGSITNISGYTIHTFSSTGTFVPQGSGYAEVLVVGAGGGGNGGSLWGGGGGGGSVQYQKFIPVLSGVSYPMLVSAGGLASAANGGASTCTYNGGSITAPGGMGEGKSNPLGSGGGGAANSPATIGAGIIGLGFGGGLGTPSGSGSNIGAGGGGAGGSGQNGQSGAVTPTTGQGGPGIRYSITGSPVFYGGGGSGTRSSPHPNNSPTDFGLGGTGDPVGNGNPGCIIIKYII